MDIFNESMIILLIYSNKVQEEFRSIPIKKELELIKQASRLAPPSL